MAVDSQGGEGLIIQKLQFLPRFDLSDLERSGFFFFLINDGFPLKMLNRT